MSNKFAAMAASIACAFAVSAAAQSNENTTPAIAMMAVLPTQDAPAINFAAVGNYQYLAAESLEKGGLFTDLVTTALHQSDPNRGFSVDYLDHINDSSQLANSQEIDVSFPWILPDCMNLAPLSAADQSLCTDFVASRPYFFITMATFVAPDSEFIGVTEPAKLANAIVCRPAGQIDFDLTQLGIVQDSSNLARPNDIAECFQGLIMGRYDIVSVDQRQAHQALDEMVNEDLVVELKHLSHQLTLHALAPRISANSRVNLAVLDSGMRDLGASGEWFNIVNGHLSVQN